MRVGNLVNIKHAIPFLSTKGRVLPSPRSGDDCRQRVEALADLIEQAWKLVVSKPAPPPPHSGAKPDATPPTQLTRFRPGAVAGRGSIIHR